MSGARTLERRRLEAAARIEKCAPRAARDRNRGDIIMSEFMYLFRGGAPAGSPEQIQQHMQKWVGWIKELTEKGHIKSPGNPLDRTGKVVGGPKSHKTVTDGPYAEKDVVGGYLVVEAKDIAHAVEVSSGCPIFDTGGLVEVRPIMKM
jgi:hypothetical protein